MVVGTVSPKIQNRLSRMHLKRQTWRLFILRSKMMKPSQRIFWSALKKSIQRSQRNQIYSDISSDVADNIGKKKRKKVEQEVIISLNAPRAGNVVEFLR